MVGGVSDKLAMDVAQVAQWVVYNCVTGCAPFSEGDQSAAVYV